MKLKRSVMALAIGSALAMALAGTASAVVVVELTGRYGDFGTKPATVDAPDKPGARCIYGSTDASGFAHVAGIKVYPFVALAYDRTGGLDQQAVRFTVTVQRSTDSGTTWKSIRSVAQTKTATDVKSADFSALRVSASGKAGQKFRAIATLDWLRNGAVDGHAKMRMLYYGVKWTVGDPGYVYENACDGVAD